LPEYQITDAQINTYLDRRGIKHSHIGRNLLLQAIRHRLDNPNDYRAMAMYQMLAKENNSKASRVERNIRQAITGAHHINADGDPTCNYYADGSFVSAKEFIFRAANELTCERREHM